MKTTPGGTRSHEALAKAQVLTQALPWLSRFHGATVVVKLGGNAMVDEALKKAFAQGRGLPALRRAAPRGRARRRPADQPGTGEGGPAVHLHRGAARHHPPKPWTWCAWC